MRRAGGAGCQSAAGHHPAANYITPLYIVECYSGAMRSRLEGHAYRALLFFYPAEFRHEYGGEMQHLFAMRLAQEPRLRLWLEVLADVASTAPKEHLHILAGDLSHGA